VKKNKPSGDQNLRKRKVLHNNIILCRKINRDVKHFVLDKIIKTNIYISNSQKRMVHNQTKIFFHVKALKDLILC
jgi:hypothetical protein